MAKDRFRSLPAVREAVALGRRYTAFRLALLVLAIAVAYAVVPARFAPLFWMVSGSVAFLRLLMARTRIELDHVLAGPGVRIVDAASGDDGLRKDLRDAVADVAARYGIAVPKAYLVMGFSGPVAVTNGDPRHAAVAVNGPFLSGRPTCLEPMVAHELAHVLLRHTPIMRRLIVLGGLLRDMTLGAAACAAAALLAGASAPEPWLGDALAAAVFAAVSAYAADRPRNALSRLSHAHEYAADAVAAEAVGSRLWMAVTLWQLGVAIGEDLAREEGGPDTHPDLDSRVARLMAPSASKAYLEHRQK